MDTTNPNANYFNSGATFDTSVPKPMATGAISADSLAPVTPIKLAPSYQDTNNYASISSSVPDYNDIITKLNTPTQAEENVSSSQNWIQKQMAKITGMGGSVSDDGSIETGVAQNKAANDYLQSIGFQSLGDVKSQLKDTVSRINALKRDSASIPLQIQNEFAGRGATAGGVAPIEISRQRQNTIEQLRLGSIAESLQGNITNATEFAKSAVEYEFAPLEAQLKAQMFNYNMNKDTLTREDSKRAKELETSLNERTRLLTDAKTDKTLIYGYILEAAKNGAPTLLLNKAQALANPMDALTTLGQYMSDQTAKAQALANLDKTRAEISKLNKEAQTAGTPAITNPNATKYAGALSVILGSDKFTKEQKTALVNSVNNGQDPVAVIKNQAKNIMGQTEATKVTNFEVAKAQIDDVGTALKQYYANGGKTNIFSGNFESVINKLGQVNDPKLVELAVQISSSLQQYRNAVSGTAYSVQEGKDIASIFPGIDKSEGLNNAILAGRKKAFDSTIDASYRSVLGQTYDVLNANVVNTQSPTNKTMSLDDAYNEYLKTQVQTQTPQTSSKSNIPFTQTPQTVPNTQNATSIPNMLNNIPTSKFTLSSLFKF